MYITLYLQQSTKKKNERTKIREVNTNNTVCLYSYIFITVNAKYWMLNLKQENFIKIKSLIKPILRLHKYTIMWC